MRRTGCRWSGHVYEQAAKAALPFCRRDCLRISALRRSVSARVKKESYRILTGWFFIMAMVIFWQSLYRPPVFHFSPTKDFALLLMGMLNLLYFLIALFGTVYWLPGISYSEARDAGISACRRYGGFRLLCGCLAMMAYFLFCLADRSFLHLNSDIWSCTAAGTALILGKKMHSFYDCACIFRKNSYNE